VHFAMEAEGLPPRLGPIRTDKPPAHLPNPRSGFEPGGWTFPYWDEDMAERLNRTVSGSLDLPLGRRTYEIFAAHWPYAGDNPITDGFNRAIKYVATGGTPESNSRWCFSAFRPSTVSTLCSAVIAISSGEKPATASEIW
jgi:hypothetical protein